MVSEHITAKQAIEIINRRAVTLSNLYGKNSLQYHGFMVDYSRYEMYENKSGVTVLRNTAENRKAYRQLTAAAKRIQKTPVQVEQRKAANYWKEVQKKYPKDDNPELYEETDIIDREAWNKWLNTFSNYFESCYELATMNGYHGQEAYDYADYLYNDFNEYCKQWNYFYKSGAFDEYRTKYETEQFEQQYDINDITGEVTEKADFYRGL